VCAGTFAVVSLMVGTTVLKFDCSSGSSGDTTTPGYDVTTPANSTNGTSPEDNAAENACKLGIATAVTLLSGVVQVRQ
jgi:hypothetical protein